MQQNDTMAKFDKMIIAIVVAFFVMIITVVSVNYFSNYITTAVKGYVQGAMIWSKAQKEATYHLKSFVYSQNNSDYQRYKEPLEIIEGDRQAALTLISDNPNHEKARQGFIKGGIPLEYIDQMIWLVTNFKDYEQIAQSIEIWEKADEQIQKLTDLAERLYDNVNSGSLSSGEQNQFSNRIDEIDKSLMYPVQAYVDVMTQMDRLVNNVVFWVNVVVAILLMLCGGAIAVGFIYRAKQSNEILAQSEKKLQQFNKKLEQRVKNRTKELKKTNAELEQKIEERDRLQEEILEISENERWQIGQYLHDELGQNMVAIEMHLKSLSSELEADDEVSQELQKVKEMVVTAAKNIRELSHDVTPIDVKQGNIASAFEKDAENAEKLYDFSCTFTLDMSSKMIKNAFVATHLHRIAQEALKNAGVHGEATEVAMKLTTNETNLILTIEDNGVGYNPGGEKEGIGIKLMKYRAELISGSLKIRRLDDEGGTLVRCSVPLARAKKEESFKK